MRVVVPSFAKLNLDLRVLQKRPDGYHELRTVFQTISLRDSLALQWRKSRHTTIRLDSSVEIPDNLVVRAAQAVLGHLKTTGSIEFSLRKKIPMGAGMGGGSSNAAAVLLVLPALMEKQIPYAELVGLAEGLGSDVPFFLHGGTALGMGRGTELYPLPDLPPMPVVVLATGIHVSTADAYRALNRTLTIEPWSPILREFQTIAWDLDGLRLDRLPLKNDFEGAVFEAHPQLAGYVRKLRRLGAKPAMMTGSGSAVFGVFEQTGEAKTALSAFAPGMATLARFVPRKQYRRAWMKALGPAAGGFLRQ